ncbi:MAG: hypothetical protein ACPGVV_11240, partial [Croceimicrobium sp.]
SLHFINWKLNGSNSLNPFTDFQMGCCNFGNAYCPFFFCRIRQFLGMEIPQKAADSRDIRLLQAYFQKYEVTDIEQLKNALIKLNPELKDQLDSPEDMLQALREADRIAMEEGFSNGNINRGTLSYYLFNMGNLNWINIDSFYNLPKEELTTQKILVNVAGHTDVKIIFKDLNSVLSPNGTTNGAYYFKDIPKGEAAYALGLQYIKGEAYIAISEFKIGEKVELNYQKASLERIKETLKTIDS